MLARFRRLLRRLAPSRAGFGPGGPDARTRLSLPTAPDVIYAIGDVHGCVDRLRGLEGIIARDAADFAGDKLLVYLGDYIDRGPDSAAVIQHLRKASPDGLRRVCLTGNHEQALLDVLDARMPVEAWLRLGGGRTLLSYGYDVAFHESESARRAGMIDAIPEEHVLFLRNLPVLLEMPGWLFVHAGVRPGVALDRQRDRDLTTIREPFLSAPEPLAGRRVVHGHTPAGEPIVTRGRVGIDTGACMGGPLTALRIVGDELSFVQQG